MKTPGAGRCPRTDTDPWTILPRTPATQRRNTTWVTSRGFMRGGPSGKGRVSLSLCWARTCQQASDRYWSSSGTPRGLGIPDTQPASIRCQLWALTLLEHGQMALWTPRSWGFSSVPAHEYVVRDSSSRLRALRRILAGQQDAVSPIRPSSPSH